MDCKNFWLHKKFILIIGALFLIFLAWNWPHESVRPEYGATFSAPYARELGLDPKQVLEATFTELNIKKIRLISYWEDLEKVEGQADYSDLDWQLEMAAKYNAEVILAVGKRVPRWPECHLPNWALQMGAKAQQEALLKFIRQTILIYRDQPEIKIWQVENEPFLTFYASEYCGKFDKAFFDKEIALVKQYSNLPILVTDSGELSLWTAAYQKGDQFGSTFYLYVANKYFQDMRSIMSYNIYRYKLAVMKFLYGAKPSVLIEVSIEPWLLKPIIDTPFSEQLQKMNVERAKLILDNASRTGFNVQYLWGAEWWYYLKMNGYPEIWDYIRNINGVL